MKCYTIQTEYLVRGGKWTPFCDHDTTEEKPELSFYDLEDRWYDYIAAWHDEVAEGIWGPGQKLPDFYRLAVYEADTETGETNLIDAVHLMAFEYA